MKLPCSQSFTALNSPWPLQPQRRNPGFVIVGQSQWPVTATWTKGGKLYLPGTAGDEPAKQQYL
jgi:hypothetical protein